MSRRRGSSRRLHDGGSPGATSVRMCVGCGRRRGQAELVRFSGGPAGLRAYLDRAEGRGAYVCPGAGCLEQAVKRKALQRALGTECGLLTVRQLRESIHEALLQKIQRLLGLALRARRVVAGTRGVWQALQGGRVRLLLFSRDMLPRTEKQFRVEAERCGTPVVALFSREELGAVLGRPPREVVGVLDGGFANGILQAVRYWVS